MAIYHLHVKVIGRKAGSSAVASAAYRSGSRLRDKRLDRSHDFSAKGGVVLGICDELKVPVRFVGVGEKIGDLRPFDPTAFVDALYSDAGTSDASAGETS